MLGHTYINTRDYGIFKRRKIIYYPSNVMVGKNEDCNIRTFNNLKTLKSTKN